MPRFTRAAWAGTEGMQAAQPTSQAAPPVQQPTFEQTLASIAKKQASLSARWSKADTKQEREAVRKEARAFVTEAIVESIFPAWMGTPWTMYAVKDGLKPDALYPGEEGKGVSCSYFIASILTNAGLRLESRSAFAGAIALHIQRSLAPDEEDLHRYWNVTPAEFEDRLVALGEGLYIVGLNCHVGFIVVEGGEARFVHSSYVDPFEVVDEKVDASEAIANSEKSGYVVTTLFKDDRLIEHWLEGKEVAFQKP
ncbi:MAG: hypothetical protein JRG91_05940 [Deltaproteobacteria bacterium]|nr:hypothetical protein [Deltaproteobacteria bacterium]